MVPPCSPPLRSVEESVIEFYPFAGFVYGGSQILAFLTVVFFEDRLIALGEVDASPKEVELRGEVIQARQFVFALIRAKEVPSPQFIQTGTPTKLPLVA